MLLIQVEPLFVWDKQATHATLSTTVSGSSTLKYTPTIESELQLLFHTIRDFKWAYIEVCRHPNLKLRGMSFTMSESALVFLSTDRRAAELELSQTATPHLPCITCQLESPLGLTPLMFVVPSPSLNQPLSSLRLPANRFVRFAWSIWGRKTALPTMT